MMALSLNPTFWKPNITFIYNMNTPTQTLHTYLVASNNFCIINGNLVMNFRKKNTTLATLERCPRTLML